MDTILSDFDATTIASTIDFGSGTGDVEIAFRELDSVAGYRGYSFSNLTGVDQITLTLDFGELLSAESNSFPANIISRPLGSGLALVETGTGFNVDDFNVNFTFNNIFHTYDGGTTVDSGAGTEIAVAATEFGSLSAGQTSFDTTSGFDQVLGSYPSGLGDDGWLVVRGWGTDVADAEEVYVKQQVITITPGGGNTTFANDTVFAFSFDGETGDFVTAIPEPSSILLYSIGLSLSVFYRRRIA